MGSTCECGCGQSPKGETARFVVGHDARHKSALIRAVIDHQDQDAEAELERRGWTKFLEKARSARVRTTEKSKRAASVDGLPINALRIEPDADEDTIAGLIEGRHIVVRRDVRGIQFEERLQVGRIRLVAEGEIDFWIRDHDNKGDPVLNQCRTIRIQDIAGVLNT